MHKTLATLILSVCLAPTGFSEEPDQWEIADQNMLRLSPSDFPALPSNIKKKLEDLSCLIPQADYRDQPNNVIQGHFRNSSTIDWAVLCSVNRKSSILVFWGGSETIVEEVQSWASSEDKFWLQGGMPGEIIFSRSLAVADAKYIKDRAEWYGGILPSHIDHEGIDEGLLGKASSVHYWFDGQWLSLQGAD